MCHVFMMQELFFSLQYLEFFLNYIWLPTPDDVAKSSITMNFHSYLWTSHGSEFKLFDIRVKIWSVFVKSSGFLLSSNISRLSWGFALSVWAVKNRPFFVVRDCWRKALQNVIRRQVIPHERTPLSLLLWGPTIEIMVFLSVGLPLSSIFLDHTFWCFSFSIPAKEWLCSRNLVLWCQRLWNLPSYSNS